MQSYFIKLTRSIFSKNKSRLFNPIDWPISWKYIPDGYTFFFQLALHETCDDQGMLYCFIHQDNANDYMIMYYPSIIDLKKLNVHQKGYAMTFHKTYNDDDDRMKIWGKPMSINVEFDDEEILLFQYDPYDVMDSPLFFGLDGYVYVMINKTDLVNKNYHKAYLVIDRL